LAWDVLARMGRRSVVLAVTGGAWITFGLCVLLIPEVRFDEQPDPTHLLSRLDSPWPGWLWLLCGLVAAVYGLGPRRWPDALGFVALAVPCAFWTLVYTWSFAIWGFSTVRGGLIFGRPQSIGAAIFTGAFLAVLLVCATWPDPTGTEARIRARDPAL
jgi:drug/metabolite transporter (DMT)-like permease